MTINETTYNDDDSNSTFVFKIRTVDIQPENGTNITTGFNDGGDNGGNVDNIDNGGGEQIEKDKDSKSSDNNNNNETTTERSVETVEDPGNNEIPDNQVETLTA